MAIIVNQHASRNIVTCIKLAATSSLLVAKAQAPQHWVCHVAETQVWSTANLLCMTALQERETVLHNCCLCCAT
jgi:hypothetical protein